MYKTILVPIDLAHPEKAEPMIEVAKKVADKDAEIILVNLVEEIPRFVAAQLPDGSRENEREESQTALQEIAKVAGLKVDVVVRSGPARAGILEVAKERNVDLILIGSHKPGLQDYLLGSTAARVVPHAKCSVFVIR